jgi:glycogen synthase
VAFLRLGEYFHFTGFLRGADIERMYAMSDVYVMPSVSEPFGITPLEAMVHNVPVIVSKQSGVAEILDNAIKVDFWDVDGLARSIIRVLTDQDFAKKMAECSSRQLRGIKWELAAEKVLSIYHELV